MHLSQVIIRNYRSIEALCVRFTKGKNAIVGKNNSGKTNIISAINLVLGEYSPTYAKSQNIETTDFFQGDTSRKISIFCQITRDVETDDLDYVEMGKETKGLYKYSDPIALQVEDLTFPDAVQIHDSEIQKIFDIDFEGTRKKNYVAKDVYIDEFGVVSNFGYAFTAWMDDSGRIHKEMRLLYREGDVEDWTLANTSYLRNSLIQSMILPSFRDPYGQLRITDYSWYGKLLRRYTAQVNTTEFEQARDKMKEVADRMFCDLVDQINSPGTQIAFPGTKVNIQCAPQHVDAHKQALIYVDDGFESLLTDKGAGVQSSVIIGLFSYYIRNVASGSALMVVEEPELYLHPHGRRIISRQFDTFLEDSRNQVIFTTHSPEFISGPKSDFTLVRVSKDRDGKTTAKNVMLSGLKEISLISKSQNAEIFFADAVVLVEGSSDKVLLELVASWIGTGLDQENWLSEHNVSVISVGGKGQFPLYAKILEALDIHWFILSDFDFLLDGCLKFLREEPRTDHIDSAVLSELHNILNSIGLQNKQHQPKVKYLDNVSDDTLKGKILRFLKTLGTYDVFILEGDLEKCYTDRALTLFDSESGHTDWRPTKDEMPLYLIYRVLPDEVEFTELVKVENFKPLLQEVMRYFRLF